MVVFLFAFGGYLAAWSGLWTPSSVDDYGNTVLFNLLDAGGRKVWPWVLRWSDQVQILVLPQ